MSFATVADLGTKIEKCGVTKCNIHKFLLPKSTQCMESDMGISGVPELYRLLLNRFLGDILTLSDNKHVTKTTIKNCFFLDNGELKLYPKLSHIHFTVKIVIFGGFWQRSYF